MFAEDDEDDQDATDKAGFLKVYEEKEELAKDVEEPGLQGEIKLRPDSENELEGRSAPLIQELASTTAESPKS